MKNKNIQHNIQAHNKIFKVYNIKHSEIYNPIEQDRIKKVILNIVKNDKNLNILDVGAGTGNLALKFLDLRCKVTASDVSIKSLELLKRLSNNNPRLKLAIIKDKKLPFQDNQFDVVCTYSVLHHIPDYLFTIHEMIRVCKPNGLIYIDHEGNENRWNPEYNLSKYNSLSKQTNIEHFKKLLKTGEIFSKDFWKSLFIMLFINKRHKREGDIHVWRDDHVEWEKIKKIIKAKNCRIIQEVDYLMYKPKEGIKLYNKYKKLTNDTKYIIAKR
jgi:ubiquinone/menaquinone biosynthesis C-methylase UbiE